jgi:crotonobetainyl-CoA:carnitine CoA-transferase CaiB-like acyl-CoA transferase
MDHLHARDYFQQVEHPELGRSVTYPGGFVMTDRGRLAIRRRAPVIGEHNVEIYCEELGLTYAELTALRDAHVV